MIIQPHLRAFILWSGTALCLLIAAAFVVSAFRPIILAIPDVGWIAVSGGSVAQANDNSVWLTIALLDRSDFPSLASWNAWYWSPLRVAPIYSVFLMVAVPTLLVWRFVPKYPRGQCRRCGYDLTGNVSGVCPECGSKVSN